MASKVFDVMKLFEKRRSGFILGKPARLSTD